MQRPIFACAGVIALLGSMQSRAATFDYTLTGLGPTRYEYRITPVGYSFGMGLNINSIEFDFDNSLRNIIVSTADTPSYGVDVDTDVDIAGNPANVIFVNFFVPSYQVTPPFLVVDVDSTFVPGGFRYITYRFDEDYVRNDFGNATLTTYTPYQSPTTPTNPTSPTDPSSPSNPNVMPEPASLLILSAAVAGTVLARKRR